MASKKPEKTFRIGYVSASIFVNDTETDNGKRQFRNVVVQRSYKDGDETKFVSSFGLGDLPQAIRVLQLAQEHVERKEASGEE